jgi:DNA repair exonuclease SbcCD ATPase subunit
MRVVSLELEGFRGFATHQALDLDADAVVIVGANGNGKTSLFDAVLWAISGNIPRLGGQDPLLVSKYSETGQARVVLRLRALPESTPITITRIFDGQKSRVSVDTGTEKLQGPEAEGRLIQLIWRDAAAAAVPADALSSVLTRCVYLQQDLIRQFIDSVTEQERFAAVSELLGAGRVTELQVELERQKAAWTKATNAKNAELTPVRSRLATMEARLAELKDRASLESDAIGDEEWKEWWTYVGTIAPGLAPIDKASREAATKLDSAFSQLDVSKRSVERQYGLAEGLQRDVAAFAVMKKPDLSGLRDKVTAAKNKADEARGRVAEEQTRIAEVRRLQAGLKERSEQLKALAALALKHLGDKCPVCEQQYNAPETRRRLEQMAAGFIAEPSIEPARERLPELLSGLSASEQAQAVAELELRKAEQSAREYEATESGIQRRLAELDMASVQKSDQPVAIKKMSEALQARLVRLRKAQETGEAFTVKIARTGEQATIEELEREIAATKTKLQAEDKEIARRTTTGARAQTVIEALREAASLVVTERVREIEPLLGDMYSRIDVHPAFRVVKFLASMPKGRGHLATVVSDPISEVDCDSPNAILSSSAMNALGVCVFLSLSLGVSRPPLSTIILDDPLQSLDDINLLGLIDLLRQTKDQRQLFVSTHDVRFGSLLSRKLRPRTTNQKTLVVELEGWSRRGPVCQVHEVKCDPAPIRLAS